jgi:hypothetical protein
VFDKIGGVIQRGCERLTLFGAAAACRRYTSFIADNCSEQTFRGFGLAWDGPIRLLKNVTLLCGAGFCMLAISKPDS